MPALPARPAAAVAHPVRRGASALRALGVAAAVAVLAAPAGAQGRDEIPDEYRPPPGMCRVWIDGVPASRQPAPTDCPTAIRNRPSNARVIFGERQPPPSTPAGARGLRPSDRGNDRPDEKPDTARTRRDRKPAESPDRAVIDEARKLLEKRRKP